MKEFVYTRLYALTVHTRLQTSQVTRLRLDHAFPPIHSGKFLTLERHVKTFECLTEHLKIFFFAPSIIKTSTNDDLRFLFFGFGRRFFVFLFLAPSSAKTNTWSHAIELLKGSNVTKKNFKMRRTTSSTISEQYKEKTTKNREHQTVNEHVPLTFQVILLSDMFGRRARQRSFFINTFFKRRRLHS